MSRDKTMDKLPAAAADIASEIRKLARMKSSRQSAKKDWDVGTGSIQHLIAISVGEIDRVIAELTQVRGHLQNESERVQSEIAGCTQMMQGALQVALTSTDTITQNLPQFRSARSGPGLQMNSVTLDQFEEQ